MTEEEAKETEEKTNSPNLVYLSLFLHSAGKEINEENVKKLVNAVNVEIDDAQIKALVAALENVDIDELKEKAVSVPTSTVATPESGTKENKEEEKESEEEAEKKEEEAAEGLGALFG